MRQLNKIQNLIFLVGATLMVVGAGASVLAWKFAPYVFAVGAIAFTSMQLLQRYEGTNFVIRRLRRMMILSDFLFLLSALLMFALLIAALLQLYSIHRIDRELAKETNSSSKKL